MRVVSRALVVVCALIRASTASAETGGAQPESAPNGESAFARLLLMPDISAIVAGGLAYPSYDASVFGARDVSLGAPRRVIPYFQELELALQAVVDPYARADVFVGFHGGSTEVEEAYLTALKLPAGLLARGGALFAPFGRLNGQHPHTWDFVDQPLPNARLLAPEVLAGPGGDVAWLAPLPWFAELRVAYQRIRSSEGRSEPEVIGLARVLQYFAPTDGTTVSIGASGGVIQNAAGTWATDLSGVDAYVRIRPGPSIAYVGLLGEALLRRDRRAGGQGSRWGGYGQAVYRPSHHFELGARYEHAPGEMVAGVLEGIERRATLLTAWMPSEFERIRLQGAWDRLPRGITSWQATLAIEFSIGAHGAHAF